MKAEVYNLKNESVGTIDLPEDVFGVSWKPDLVRQVLIAQMANRRQPWAHAKGRSEVRGGGRKPWRQKGTGRARHGSIRSPLWRGGGKSHGPQKTRDYSQKVNKKMRRLAVFSVISKKLNESQVKIFGTLEIQAPKTKSLAHLLRFLLKLPKKAKNFDLLLVPVLGAKNLVRAAANLPKVKVLGPRNLNLYDCLNHKQIFIDRGALPEINGSSKFSKKK